MHKKSYTAIALFVIGFMLLNLLGILLFTHYPAGVTLLRSFLTHLTPVEGMIALFVVQEIVLLALLRGVFTYWQPRRQLKDIVVYFQKRRKWKGWGNVRTYVCGGLLLYFLCNALLAILVTLAGIEIPGLYGEQVAMSLLEAMPLLRSTDYLLLLLFVVLIGPAIEELIYRGFVTDVLMRGLGGWGVVLAAALFAVAHLEWGVVWNLLLLSLFLGYIYYKTKSMRYSFLFHVAVNGIAMGLMLVARLYPELVTAFMF